MIKPQKIYKVDSCESMDSILTSTLCMRKWAGMVNCQDASKSTEEQKDEHKKEGPNKICKKSKTINIIRQDRQISTGTVLVGGLAMILLFIARPTRAGDYPYTEVTSEYKPYMKQSNIAIESMHQIITQASNLIKSDDAYQQSRMAILNRELPDITMISDMTKSHLKKIDEGANKLPQTVLGYVAAI